MAESDKTLKEDGNRSNNNRNNSVPNIVPISSGTVIPDTHPTHHAAVSEPSTLKRKQTSFQITSVTVKGSRLSTDGGEDSADDLDESHTEDASSDILDCSRTTDVDNDQLSEDNSNTTNNDDVSTTAPSIAVKCKIEMPVQQNSQNDVALKFPSEASKSEEPSMLNENTQSDFVKPPDLPDQWQHRFRVVKIVSSEPFKRGRWLCLDFMDPPAPVMEAKAEIVESSISPNIQLISNSLSESIPADKIAHIYEISPGDAYPGSISVAVGSDQIQQPMYGIFLPINNGQYPLITGMHSKAIPRPLEKEVNVHETIKSITSSEQGSQQSHCVVSTAQNISATSLQQPQNVSSAMQNPPNVTSSLQRTQQNISTSPQQSLNAATNLQQLQNVSSSVQTPNTNMQQPKASAGMQQQSAPSVQQQNVSPNMSQQNISTNSQQPPTISSGMQQHLGSNIQQQDAVTVLQPQNINTSMQQPQHNINTNVLQSQQNINTVGQSTQNISPNLQQNINSNVHQQQNVSSNMQPQQNVSSSLELQQNVSSGLQHQNIGGSMQMQQGMQSQQNVSNVQPQNISSIQPQQNVSGSVQPQQNVSSSSQPMQSIGNSMQLQHNVSGSVHPQEGSCVQQIVTNVQQQQNTTINVPQAQNVMESFQHASGNIQHTPASLQSQNVPMNQSVIENQQLLVGQPVQGVQSITFQQPQKQSTPVVQSSSLSQNAVNDPKSSTMQPGSFNDSVAPHSLNLASTMSQSQPTRESQLPSQQGVQISLPLQSQAATNISSQNLSTAVSQATPEVSSTSQMAEMSQISVNQVAPMQPQQVAMAQTSTVGTQATSVSIPEISSTSSIVKQETVVPSQVVQNHIETKELGTPPSSNLQVSQEVMPEVPSSKSDINGEESESVPSGTSTVAIDNKIEQAMDLVKSHLMFAVREEVDVLKEKITELMDRISQLEYENGFLRANASQQTLEQLNQTQLLQQQQQNQPLTVSINSIPAVSQQPLQQTQLNIQNQQPTS